MALITTWEKNGLYNRYVGQTTVDELISSSLKISGDSRFDNLKYIISDWSDSEPAGMKAEDVEKLICFINVFAQSNPNILNPSIMPKNDDYRQALVGLYVALMEDSPWDATWFKTVEESREWIASKIDV